MGHTWAITELEAEVFEVKLTRIWGVVAPFRVSVNNGGLDLRAPVSQDVELRVSASAFDTRNCAQYALHEIGPNLSFLRCNDFFDLLEPTQTLLGDYWTSAPKDIRELQNQWMPVFRRCCWLCGCDIEASAHEKAVWIQGFSREELDAWDLKM